MPVDPTNLSPADFQRWECVGWLRTLIGGFRELRDHATDAAEHLEEIAEAEEHDATSERLYRLATLLRDVDPSATGDMLRECAALADELEAELAIGAVLDGKPFDLPESSYEDALEAARKRLRNLPHLP